MQRFRQHSVAQENGFQGLAQLTQRIVGASHEHWLWIKIFSNPRKAFANLCAEFQTYRSISIKREARFRPQTYPKPPGGNHENSLATGPCRAGNRLCVADPCSTNRHTRSTTPRAVYHGCK